MLYNAIYIIYVLFLKRRRPPIATRSDTLYPYPTLLRAAHAAFLHVATASRQVTSQPMSASIIRSCASGRRSPMAWRLTLRYGSNPLSVFASPCCRIRRSVALPCLRENRSDARASRGGRAVFVFALCIASPVPSHHSHSAPR